MRFLHRLEEWTMILLLAAMTLVSFGQVIARYVFNYSFTWALELVTYLFGALIFLGMAYGVRVHAHIGIDALVKALGPRAVRACGAVAAALCTLYSVILFYGSWKYVLKMKSIGIMAEDLPVEQWIPRLVLVIGFGVLIVRFLLTFWSIASGRDVGLKLGDEAADALRQNEPARDGERSQP